MPVARPPRTDAHRQRDAFIAQFAAVGLQARIGTNGSRPDADIEVTIERASTPKDYGKVTDCVLTDAGRARLEAAS